MIIPIVDEDDNIINHIERDDRNNIVINRASCLWVTNSKGEILLAKRSLRKIRNPGKWGPAVVGTVEKDESYEQNIVREAEEELQLTGIIPMMGPKIRIKTKWNYFVQVFFFVLDKEEGDFIFNEDEVSDVKWYSLERLREEVADNPGKFNASLPQYMKVLCQ